MAFLYFFLLRAPKMSKKPDDESKAPARRMRARLSLPGRIGNPMLRKFVFLLSLICLGAWGITAISCGSSSNAPTSNCTGTYNVVGTWQGTFHADNTSLTVFGAIDSAGLALFFDNSPPGETGDTLALPAITGACYFSGDITAYAEPGSVQPGNPIAITDTAQGNVGSTTSITGVFSGTTSGNFSAVSFSPLSGSVAALTGSLTGQVEGTINGQGVLLNLTFSQPNSGSAGMTFTGTEVGTTCTVSGSFDQVATNNVFDVSIAFSGSGCPATGTVTGIGFESNTDYFDMNGSAAGTYLYADLLAPSGPFVLEIFPASAR
jgi:hypothetical protein